MTQKRNEPDHWVAHSANWSNGPMFSFFYFQHFFFQFEIEIERHAYCDVDVRRRNVGFRYKQVVRLMVWQSYYKTHLSYLLSTLFAFEFVFETIQQMEFYLISLALK